ncbi:hypothetical protein [Haladaptatus sp. DYF46]|uniref:hypothetical protein n=1 Tax=Haladaptatus sp. DYF46 TaxID=2886041 RepID=UPI001E570FC9|nr:hypothetical protein [Haladaptatus sp. DYF46]
MPQTIATWGLSLLGNLLLASPLAPVVEVFGVSLPEQFAFTLTSFGSGFVSDLLVLTCLLAAHFAVVMLVINALRLGQYASERYQEVVA